MALSQLRAAHRGSIFRTAYIIQHVLREYINSRPRRSVSRVHSHHLAPPVMYALWVFLGHCRDASHRVCGILSSVVILLIKGHTVGCFVGMIDITDGAKLDSLA